MDVAGRIQYTLQCTTVHYSTLQYTTVHYSMLMLDGAGGTIAGRNMDGENDFRRLTVTNLVIFAVEPTEPGMK
jgi:hypothetical protein